MGEMVGGWLDKAYSTARSIADLDEAEYYWARARLADRRQHFAGAEREFRAALEVAPNEVGRTLDLATFLCSRGRYGESEAVFRGTVRRWNPCDRVMGRAHLGLEPVAEYLNVGSNDTIETSLLPLPKKKPKRDHVRSAPVLFELPGHAALATGDQRACLHLRFDAATGAQGCTIQRGHRVGKVQSLRNLHSL